MEQVTEKVWRTCKGITNISPDSSVLYFWKAPNPPKDHWIVCGIGQHCKMGQKIKITLAKHCQKHKETKKTEVLVKFYGIAQINSLVTLKLIGNSFFWRGKK